MQKYSMKYWEREGLVLSAVRKECLISAKSEIFLFQSVSSLLVSDNVLDESWVVMASMEETNANHMLGDVLHFATTQPIGRVVSQEICKRFVESLALEKSYHEGVIELLFPWEIMKLFAYLSERAAIEDWF